MYTYIYIGFVKVFDLSVYLYYIVQSVNKYAHVYIYIYTCLCIYMFLSFLVEMSSGGVGVGMAGFLVFLQGLRLLVPSFGVLESLEPNLGLIVRCEMLVYAYYLEGRGT